LILDLRDDLGLSALVVSHDLGLAWNIADRVAVMYLGRIVEIGTVDEVLRNPQHPYTKALIAVLPDRHRDPDATRTPLGGEPPDPTAIPSGCRFHPRCPLRASLPADDERRSWCTDRDVPVLPMHEAGGRTQVACHLVSS